MVAEDMRLAAVRLSATPMEYAVSLASGRLAVLPKLKRCPDTYTSRSARETPRAAVNTGRWIPQSALEALSALLLGVRTVDARTLVRARALAADGLIWGGVLVVPLAAICVAIGAVLPGSAPLRQHIESLFALAILWFFAALLAAHFQRRRTDDRAAE